jgi:hypothetical protein
MRKHHLSIFSFTLAAAFTLFPFREAPAQLPKVPIAQVLPMPPRTAPQPPPDQPAHFGLPLATDGETAIVTVDQGPAAYAYVKKPNGKWRYEGALVVPAGATATSGAAVFGDDALIQGEADSQFVVYAFHRNAGEWTLTQTLPGGGKDIPYGVFMALGENFAAIGNPRGNNDFGNVEVYSMVGAGTYLPEATLLAAGSQEGYFTGYNTIIDGQRLAVASPGNAIFSVFVRESPGIWTEQAQLRRTDTFFADGQYDFSNRRIVIGSNAQGENYPANPQVFVRNQGTWSLEQTLEHPYDPQVHLTNILALDGKRLVVTDWLDHVFLFEQQAQGWVATAELAGAKPHSCALASPFNWRFTLAISGRWVFGGCGATQTRHPSFDGQVLVYQLPPLQRE